ncbi:PepSY-associated TM helix domain-containing protein [Mariniflexile sp. HMF6888]|uniref:PepSY-associated TM helix domain-containing protein n=1 Tax=Mariniflexile sp. HMF6888 TaxID=3373086 RepID=UPI0037955CF1
MKITRKKLFNIHSWIGIKLSILFFIVCFSGTLATLSHEMDWLFISEIRATPQKELASKNLIIANLKKIYPEGKITYWMKNEEPYLCDIIYMKENGKQTYVFANPYTGIVQGHANLTFHRFFRDLHYFLFIPFQIGNFMVLSFSFLLLISLMTALFFCKKWWKKLFVLQTGKGPLIFFRSLHRLVGLWSIPFTLLFSITGIWYFIERTNIGGVGKEVNPKSPTLEVHTEKKHGINLSYDLDYDKVTAISEKAIPYFKAQSLNPPTAYNNTIYVRGTSDVALVRQRANRVYIDPYTYKIIKVQNAKNINTTMWINDIADPLHFGYWGGLATKIIWFFMGLGISSLILTGIWITLKRKAQQKKKQNKKVLGIWKYLNWSTYALMMMCMYIHLISHYRASLMGIIIISLGWGILIILTYYFFVYLLNKKKL